jgi:asparagine synthase (glutamine-hydrolysing)
VRELLPGERLRLSSAGDATFSWLWTPAPFAERPRRRSPRDAQAELRSLAEDCLAAWTSDPSHIAVRMSGGLDSSVVASLASRHRTGRVTGIHLVGRGYESHELQLARIAARRAGVELIELEMEHSTADLDAVLKVPRLARPTGQILGASADTVIVQACEALGADCIMTGHGGDSLFLQRSIAGDTLTDYMRLEGYGRDFWRVAYDTAILTQKPIWNVLGGAVLRSLQQKPWQPLAFLNDPGAAYRTILTEESVAAIPASYLSHAWLEDARSLPPCKAEQVRGMVALRNYHPLLEHALRFASVQPLISQPLVEFSLSLPAYQFTDGGTDRSLERRAFSDLLPPEVATRLQKGFINHHLTDDIVANVRTLRAFVLDGQLVSNGVVSRPRAETLFSETEVGQARSLAAILNLLAAESWLASWRRGHRASAV